MAKSDLDAIQRLIAAKSGVADPDALAKMRQGAVFEVADGLIHFPNNPVREWHHGRRVIVVQGHMLLGGLQPDTVLVVPCSASQAGARMADFAVPDGEPGFTKPGIVAFTSMVMPIPKRALTADGHRGVLTPETFGALMGRIAQNLDMMAALKL